MSIKLTVGQRTEPLWRLLADQLRKDLENLRRQNDSKSLTEVETAFLRGKIAHVKEMLGYAEDDPQFQL